MSCKWSQSLFSEKNKKFIINLLSTEFTHRVVKNVKPFLNVMLGYLNWRWGVVKYLAAVML